MDELSQELVDHIVFFASVFSVELSRLATVSRMFQRLVERLSFSYLSIKATDAEIDEFKRIWNPRRRLLLRVLSVNVPVRHPPCNDIPNTANKYIQVDVRATMAPLLRLWNFLSSAWDEMALEEGNVTLELLLIHSANWEEHGLLFLPIDLTADAEGFQPLPFVRKFSFESDPYYWHPRMLVALASRMPNLEGIYGDFECAEQGWGRYYSIDKQCLSELVQIIKVKCLPSSVKNFVCHLKTPTIFTIAQLLPRLIEHNTPDPVGLAMRELTRHCDNISISGSFGPSLFEPPMSVLVAEAQPCWQSTTRLRVKMSVYYPDGSWLFRPREPFNSINLHEGMINCTQLPPGYGNTKEEREAAFKYFQDHPETMDLEHTDYTIGSHLRFDAVPDDEKLNTLLVAFARCCARMPALKVARISLIELLNNALSWDWPIKGFAVVCVAPFSRKLWEVEELYRRSLEVEESSSWTVLLRIGNWRPTSATIAELEYIGTVKGGQPSTVSYIK
ncbi:hypothetical protein F4679DRAFT_596793 [Xylaria curta]|nr:hypothetical protein F4679DRAFT_596793 [Xylaria curta]